MNEVAPQRRLHAFIDEAGQRSASKASSDHFIMSAVVLAEEDLGQAHDWWAQLRLDLRRREGDTLHRTNLKSHSERLHAACSLGAQPYLTISTVVVCKRHVSSAGTLTDDEAYLYTLRYLLERLSWLARDQRAVLSYTLAHIRRFKLERLREYEHALQAEPDCRIAWAALDPKGGTVDQPKRLDMLQVADLAASSTFSAFEPDPYGNTETRYLLEMAGRLYRRGNGALTSYGLKMHPWSDSTKAAYPWVAALASTSTG